MLDGKTRAQHTRSQHTCTYHGLGVRAGVVLRQVVSALFLGSAANLADHDDPLCLGVVDEGLKTVHEVGAVEGVAANAHARGLTQTGLKKCDKSGTGWEKWIGEMDRRNEQEKWTEVI